MRHVPSQPGRTMEPRHHTAHRLLLCLSRRCGVGCPSTVVETRSGKFLSSSAEPGHCRLPRCDSRQCTAGCPAVTWPVCAPLFFACPTRLTCSVAVCRRPGSTSAEPHSRSASCAHSHLSCLACCTTFLAEVVLFQRRLVCCLVPCQVLALDDGVKALQVERQEAAGTARGF